MIMVSVPQERQRCDLGSVCVLNQVLKKMGRWEEDIELMEEAVQSLFVNDLEKSESLLKKGMNKDAPALKSGDKDIRGSFALVYALVSLMKGIATFSDDTLKECAVRLREADSLAAQDVNWAGKKVVRGVCTLEMGVIEFLERSIYKGLYHVVKSWGWIRTLKTEALVYEGKERLVVRSAAQFTLGAFYLLIGLLPPAGAKWASWLSGFPGDRHEGLKMIRGAWQEGGLMAPWAALTLISYHVDTKTFLSEPLTKQEVQETKELVDWAAKKYPGSLFFTGLAADFVAVTERNVSKARAMQEAEATKMEGLPALKWALNYKRGIYALTDLNWKQAGVYFQDSTEVYIAAGRRSMVPFMFAYSLFCALQHGKEEGVNIADNAKAKEMVEALTKYKNMKKKNWGRQDEWAFEALQQYGPVVLGDKQAGEQHWALLRLAMVMVLQVRCTWWMNEAQLGALVDKLIQEQSEREKENMLSVEHKIQVALVRVEIMIHLKRDHDALAIYKAALELPVTKKEKDFGAIPYLHFLIAKMYYAQGDLASTKDCAKLLKKAGKKYYLHSLLMLKIVVLNRAVGEDLENEYTSIDVKAGSKTSVEIIVQSQNAPPSAAPTEGLSAPMEYASIASAGDEAVPRKPLFINWYWLINKHNVGFQASFSPSNGGPERELQKFDRLDASDIAHSGGIEIEESGPGKLVLTWDNSFSYIRSKRIQMRLNPPETEYKVITG